MRSASCTCLWTAAIAASLLSAASASAVSDVVISQVWGGGGNGAALPNADYVELFNRTANPVNMSGWSVQVASATGTTWASQPLNATIQPYSYYLIRVSTASATGIAISPDLVFTTTSTSLISTTGKVALRSVSTALTGACPVTDGAQNATILDFVGYGTTTSCREGTANAAVGTNTAVFRGAGGCIDSDQNSADFTPATPDPRNAATPSPGPCGVTGACCDVNTGVCSVVAGIGACSGTYQGDSTSCSPNPCPPSGACCNGATGSTCSILTSAGCSAISGFYQGNATVCSPSPCTTSSCCFSDGTCCNLFAPLCAQQGGTSGTGSCTTVGNCIAAPANDTCATAVALSLGVTRIGNIFAASTNDGLNTNCSTVRASKGVWFTFTPPVTSVYEITSCPSTFDTILGVYQLTNCADTTTWTYVACDDDACPVGSSSFCGTSGNSAAGLVSGVELAAGIVYHILLAADSTSATAGGNYSITVNDLGLQPSGACCNNTSGVCSVQTSAGCAANTPVGTYQGDGTLCGPSTCAVTGGCCFSGGVCVIRPASGCTGTNIYQGDNTTCAPDPCTTGACCNNSTGACTVTLSTGCSATTSSYQGDFTTCTPSPCPPPGSCCNPCTGACLVRVQSACADVWTIGGVCTPNTCFTSPAPPNDQPAGAITLALGNSVTGFTPAATDSGDGSASSCHTTVAKGMWYSFTPPSTGFYAISTCGATFDTALTVYDAADMNTPMACDSGDTCTGSEPVVCGTSSANSSADVISFTLLNAGTTYLIRVQAESTTAVGSFPLLVTSTSAGACCNNTTGVCTLTAIGSCSASTSTYQGDNTVCTPSPCPPATDVAIVLTSPFSACNISSGTPLQTVYTVTNNGPLAATGVVATFGIPSVFGFQNASPSGVISLGTLNISIGNLAPSQSVVITLNGVTSSGSGSVTASVAHGLLDTTPANNTTTAQGIYVAPTIALPAQLVLSDLLSSSSSSLPSNGSFFTGSGIDSASAEVFSRPFASPTGSRFILSVNTDLTATQSRVLVIGTHNPLTLTVVAQEGISTLDQGDTVGEFDYAVFINEIGQYAFGTTTDAAATNNDVIVRGQGLTHTVVAREGDAANAVGFGVTYSGANVAAGIRPNGDVAFTATLAGTGGTTTDTAIFDNNGATLVAQEGFTIPTGASDAYQAFTNISTSEVGQGYFANGASGYNLNADLNGATASDEVLVVDGNIVLREGDAISGFPDLVSAINYNFQSANGDWLAYGSTGGTSTLDFVMRNGTVLARTDAPIFVGAAERFDDAPYAQTFFGFVTNSAGDYVICGTTNGAVFSNGVMVVNNQRVIVRENDPVDANNDGIANDDLFIDIFRDDRMFLTDDGWLYFVARLRGPLTTCTAQPAAGANEALLRININQGATAVCCRGATCNLLSQANCTPSGTAGAVFFSGNSTCNAPGNVLSPCCFADYDKIGGITVQDIFAFLNDWFASSGLADFGGNGSTAPVVADIFDFLNAWFAGGC